MDQVLRHALELDEPETFLTKPSEALDWRIATLREAEDDNLTARPTRH